LTALPSEIGSLTNLTSLDLRENHLVRLPARFVNLTNLTELDLSYNPLSELPLEFENLIKLERISFRHTFLTVHDVKKLTKFPNLKKIDISGISITKSELETLKRELPNTDFDVNPWSTATSLPKER
jgi:internalin A